MNKSRIGLNVALLLSFAGYSEAQTPPERASHLIPLAVSSPDWDTGITVVNVSDAPLTILNLVVYGSDGSKRQVACDGCVAPAHGRFSRLLSELAGKDVNGTLQLTVQGTGARKALCFQALYSSDLKQFQVVPASNLGTLAAMDLQTSKQVAIAAVHTAAVGLGAALKSVTNVQDSINQVRVFIDPIRFNPDGLGYFYVYDYDCINIAHATQKDLQGQNLYDHQDTRGKYVIRELALAAKNGGGFVEFYWVKPGDTGEHPKLGYVEPIPNTNYFIGSGVYLAE